MGRINTFKEFNRINENSQEEIEIGDKVFIPEADVYGIIDHESESQPQTYWVEYEGQDGKGLYWNEKYLELVEKDYRSKQVRPEYRFGLNFKSIEEIKSGSYPRVKFEKFKDVFLSIAIFLSCKVDDLMIDIQFGESGSVEKLDNKSYSTNSIERDEVENLDEFGGMDMTKYKKDFGKGKAEYVLFQMWDKMIYGVAVTKEEAEKFETA